MAVVSLDKSTIVRLRNLALRLYFGSADLVAPRSAGCRARDLWFSVPPPVPATPLPPGGESFTVLSQGAEIRGHVYGEGPVVYLVHGWGGRGGQLAAFVEPLVGAGHQVVLFDGPAHGDSGAGPSGPRRTHGVELGHALDDVAARFGPAEAVIAHSLGTISTYLALRYGWLGTRRLVLVAPMVEAAGYFDQFQAALGFGGRTRQAFEHAVSEFVGLPVADFDATVLAAHVDRVPTLVVHDVDDRQTPYAEAQRLVRTIPQAELVTTEGLGHRRILRDPAVVARVVDFVGGGRREDAA